LAIEGYEMSCHAAGHMLLLLIFSLLVLMSLLLIDASLLRHAADG